MTSQIVLSIIFFLVLLTFRGTVPAVSSNINDAGYKSLEGAGLSLVSLGLAGKEITAPKNLLGDLAPEAKSVYVFDLSEEKTLYEKDAFSARPLASLTKLMTALLLEERAPDGVFIPISIEAIRQEGDDGFRAGDKFRKEDLEDIVLAASSNDAAWAAAEFMGSSLGDDGGTPVEKFVFLMNERARDLGFSTFSFASPHGLDLTLDSNKVSGASGSASEIGKLFEYIFINYPNIIEKTRVSDFRVISEAGRSVEAQNTNKAFGSIPQLIGGKTGFTELAGGNLVFIFDAGFSRPVLISILGSSEKGRFEDAEKIVTAVLKYFSSL